MKLEFTEITHICVDHFKSFGQVKSTQNETMRFIKGSELKYL